VRSELRDREALFDNECENLILAVTLMLVQHSGTGQPEPNRVGLVLVHGDGTVVKQCVEFSEDSITGAEVLQRAGLKPVVSAYGGLGYSICAIDGEGCAAGKDCFCQCRKSPCSYWVYSHRQQDGTWAISGVGASSWRLCSGDIDGWVWGDGSETPPPVAFENVCPAEAKGVVASPGLATAESPTVAALLPSRVEPAPGRTILTASATPTTLQQTVTSTSPGQVMIHKQTSEEATAAQTYKGPSFPVKYVVFGVILLVLISLIAFGGRVWH